MLFQEENVREKKIGRTGSKIILQNKKERKRSQENMVFHLPPKSGKTLPGKVSPCTSLKRCRSDMLRRMKRASLTVETALIVPLFLLGMIMMISFMDIYKIQTEHLTKLCQQAKQAGMYACMTKTKDITLPDIYTYEPVGGLVRLPKVWMHNQVKVHAWTGKEYVKSGEDAVIKKMVYVTESGEVYHRKPGCSYLSVSVNQISGSAVKSAVNKYGEHYSACETCSRNEKPGEVVYITKNGNRYHNEKSCSGLKRTVRMVRESDVSGMCACSRCG